MNDEEDVKKMTELLNSNQKTMQDFQYDDFINCGISDGEENEEIINFEDDDYDFCNFTTTTDISNLSSYNPRSTLKPEERLVIDSCLDPDLKNLLLLNRTKNFQLMQLYKKLKDLLIQCQKGILEKSEILTNFLKTSKDQGRSTGAWRLAAPYFKDKKLYACPANVDTIRKRKNKELSVYDMMVPKKWSNLECDKLVRAVKLNYNINQQNTVSKKIRSIQQNTDSETKDELTKLESRMEELRNDNYKTPPPLNSDEYIDWSKVAEVFLQGEKTYLECKSFWHIYLHPNINKSPWTPEENENLKKLAQQHNFQNWDEIAKNLGNNRTGFTTCMNYYGNIHNVFKKGDFTYTEDTMLVDLVQKYKMGNYIPWFKIAQHFKDRKRSQLHHRYTYYLSQNGRKVGKFTDAEDILLMILVDKFGKNFRKCCEYLPHRSTVQLRSRYNTNLQQKLKRGSFTLEDDEIIMKFVEEHGQKSWAELMKLLHRGRNQIRQRYITIQFFLEKNPNLSLASVPRRKHRITEEEEDSFDLLRVIADQFLDSQKIPSLKEIEGVLKQRNGKDVGKDRVVIEEINNSEIAPNIDDMLTDFFRNSFIIKHSKCTSSKYATKAIKDVRMVLEVLQAQLDIPENCDEDIRLDNLDVVILNDLMSDTDRKKETVDDISKLIPPNLNSLLALKSLFVMHSAEKLEHQETDDVSRKKKQQFVTDVRSTIMKELSSLPYETKSHFENDCNQFFQRFQALFKWPALMTLEEPSMELQEMSLNTFKPTNIQAKKTYSKLADPKKQLEISEMPSSSTKAVPLKLTPVTNKSVIQDLLRNKNKKLFCIQAVKCGSESKTIIKEIQFRTPSNQQGTITPSSSVNNNNKKRPSLNTIAKVSVAETNSQISNKKPKLSHFVPDRENSVTLDMENDTSTNPMEIDNSQDECVENDERDLNKLLSFVKEQSKSVPNRDHDDVEDLRKLENFLTEQNEIDADFT